MGSPSATHYLINALTHKKDGWPERLRIAGGWLECDHCSANSGTITAVVTLPVNNGVPMHRIVAITPIFLEIVTKVHCYRACFYSELHEMENVNDEG